MNLLKRIFFLIIGVFIISCSINIIIVSNLGATPWDSANFTLSEFFKISPGLATFITGGLLTICIELINYKKFKINKLVNIIITIVLGFILGLCINFTSPYIYNIIPNMKLSGIIGIVTFSIGINFIASSNLPGDPIDNFMLKIIEYYNVSISTARIITDIVALSISFTFGLLLWGNEIFNHYLGLGTVIAFFLLPISIQFFEKYVFKRKDSVV